MIVIESDSGDNLQEIVSDLRNDFDVVLTSRKCDVVGKTDCAVTITAVRKDNSDAEGQSRGIARVLDLVHPKGSPARASLQDYHSQIEIYEKCLPDSE